MSLTINRRWRQRRLTALFVTLYLETTINSYLNEQKINFIIGVFNLYNYCFSFNIENKLAAKYKIDKINLTLK